MCGVSGVLCTVTAALVLAEAGQPLMNDRHAMHRVWHTLEFVGNTIIFVLAGALVGESWSASAHIRWVDFGYLLLMWLLAMAVRGGVLVALWPAMRALEGARARARGETSRGLRG